MNPGILRTSLLLAALVLPAYRADAVDYLRLKSGRLIPCAVIRQDTQAVFTTDWESRSLAQPPLHVYAREEVESIWFSHPGSAPRGRYVPHTNGWEAGGSFAWQTWAETKQARRYLLLFSLHGGYTILPQLSLELDSDFTVPLAGHSDSTWRTNETGYQTMMNVVVHPFTWKGLVPYALAGGGAAVAIPIGDVVLTNSTDVRNLLDVGLGVKWGAGGIGYRVEWRHHLYAWTPDAVTDQGVRVPAQSADASVIRAALFIYR